MKKIVLTTLVALLLASSSFAGIVITIKVEIGRKSLPNCPAFGLCDVTFNISYQEGSVNGTLDVSNERSSMILGINERDILKVQPDKIVYLKDKKSVVFAEDFVMPAEINKAVKSLKPLVIKKGEYPLTYKNGVYFIEFPL